MRLEVRNVVRLEVSEHMSRRHSNTQRALILYVECL